MKIDDQALQSLRHGSKLKVSLVKFIHAMEEKKKGSLCTLDTKGGRLVSESGDQNHPEGNLKFV